MALDGRSINVILIIVLIVNIAIPSPPYNPQAMMQLQPKAAPKAPHPILPSSLTELPSCPQAVPVSLGSDRLEFDVLSPAIKGNVIQLELGVSVMGPQE